LQTAVVFGLADELSARWESQGDAPVCLHGDVHPKNGILRGDSFTLIDIDRAAAGNPAVDLGSLLASISYNRLTGRNRFFSTASIR
jgi:aminoglycoside phosphotransferase (APT) family kinase protein